MTNQEELKLDGNAIAGLLAEVFGDEMTLVEATCAGCGTVSMMGATDVYTNAPGAVVRCRACQAVLLTIVQGRTHYCVSVTGIR